MYCRGIDSRIILHSVFSLGVLPLVIFNIGSVVIWIVCIVLGSKGKVTLGYFLGGIEVLVHATFCVMVLGWGAGFQYYIFTMVGGAVLTVIIKNTNYISFMVAIILATVFSFFVGQVPALAFHLEPELLRILYLVNLIIA